MWCPAWCSGLDVPTLMSWCAWAHSRAGHNCTIGTAPGDSAPRPSYNTDRLVATYWRGGLGFLRLGVSPATRATIIHHILCIAFVASPLFNLREVMS